jgi:hypothetical protein
MNALIEVFRMTEIQPKTRAQVIIKLGDLINYEYGANVTEDIVFELVSLLDPENVILADERYLRAKTK